MYNTTYIQHKEGETCIACKKGKLEVRGNKIGAFLGCDRYPECKNLHKIYTKLT